MGDTSPRTLNLIRKLEEKTRTLRNYDINSVDEQINRTLGCYNDCDSATIALHAETLLYINSDKNEDPEVVIMRLIRTIISREARSKIGKTIADLLR